MFDRWNEDCVPQRKSLKRKLKAKKKKKAKSVKKPRVKKNRRSQAKFPALERKFNLPSRQDQLDFDYLHKLNDKEKAFLNKFVEEEINASFRHTNPFNKSKKARKKCYDANNSRNRCILTRNKAAGNVDSLQSVKQISQLNPEDVMIGKQEKMLEEMNNFNNRLDSTKKSE